MRQVTRITRSKLITCIVQRGKADEVIEKAMAAGVVGATTYYGRGRGIREHLGIYGIAVNVEKEIIEMIVSEEACEQLLQVIAKAGNLSTPGMGIVYSTTLDAVYTYVPEDVLEVNQ